MTLVFTLIRKIILANVYVMAVCTVIVWGLSQVSLPCVAMNVGNQMVGVGGHPQGFVFGVFSRNKAPSGLSFAPIEQVIDWRSMFQTHRPRWRLWSDNVWVQPDGAAGSREVYVGVRYWTALVFLLASFAMIKFMAYRSRMNRLTKF